MKNQLPLQIKNQNTVNVCPFLFKGKLLNSYVQEKKMQHQKLSNQFISIQQQYYTPKYEKIKYFCKNHKMIAATHFIKTSDEEKIAYCQKCSILIASQGFTVTSLTHQNNSNLQTLSNKHKVLRQQQARKLSKIKAQRQRKLEQLQFLILKNHQQILLLTQETKNVSDDMTRRYQNKIQELSQVFVEVFEFLKAQKDRCILSMQKQLIQLSAPLQNFQKYFVFSKDYLTTLRTNISILKNGSQKRNFSQSLFQTVTSDYQRQLSIFISQKDKYKTTICDQIKTISQSDFMKFSNVKSIILNVIGKFFPQSNQIKEPLNNNLIETAIKDFVVKTDPFSFGNQNEWTPTSSITKRQTISPIDLNKSFLLQLDNIQPNDIQRSKITEMAKTNDDSNVFKNIKHVPCNPKKVRLIYSGPLR